MEDESVDCIVTSPPYYGLRDYGVAGQVGLEKTPEQFIKILVKIFRECRRVLKTTGTLWINIGDSYAHPQKKRTSEQACRKSNLQGGKNNQIACKDQINKVTGDLKPKDLIGIPWMLAFALRKDGWYLRQDIIWQKPNPMPESVTDRCTKAHEYIFLLSKSPKYYYDAEAIRTAYRPKTLTTFGSKIKGYGDGSGLIMAENRANTMNERKPKVWTGRNPRTDIDNKGGNQGSEKGIPVSAKIRGHERPHNGFNQKWDAMSVEEQRSMGANKRSVWTVAVKPSKEKDHFAAYPEELITDCIKAGCPPGGIVYDPFHGTGTTGEVALRLGCNFIASELNSKYCASSNRRTNKFKGLFTQQ
jgi:DNA modification methylase